MLYENHTLLYEVVYRESPLRGGVRNCFRAPKKVMVFYRSDSFTNRSDIFFSTGLKKQPKVDRKVEKIDFFGLKTTDL